MLNIYIQTEQVRNKTNQYTYTQTEYFNNKTNQ